MRASLELLERAERYVLGLLSVEEAEQFLQEPGVEDLISFQQLAMQASERQALRNEINHIAFEFHAGGSKWSNWFFGLMIGLALSTAAVFYYLAQKPQNEAIIAVAPLADTSFHAKPFGLDFGFCLSAHLTDHCSELNFDYDFPDFEAAFEFPDLQIPLITADSALSSASEEETPESFLSLVPLDSLNFVPERFRASAKSHYKYRTRNTIEIRSLYYSFSRTKNRQEPAEVLKLGNYNNALSTSGSQIFQKITLVDGQNEPLEGIRVNIKNDPLKQVITDETGSFEISRVFRHKETYLFDLHREDGMLIRCQVRCNARKRVVIQVDFDKAGTPEFAPCSIEPMYIRTLYQPEFAQTFVATENFEERLQFMHLMPEGEEILKFYIRHIDQPLYRVDSLAAEQLSGEARAQFFTFAKEKLTGVNCPLPNVDELYAYFISGGNTPADVYEIPVVVNMSQRSDKHAFIPLFGRKRTRQLTTTQFQKDPLFLRLINSLNNCLKSDSSLN